MTINEASLLHDLKIFAIASWILVGVVLIVFGFAIAAVRKFLDGEKPRKKIQDRTTDEKPRRY